MYSLNQYIDHTLLKSTATKNDILRLCKEAVDYRFYAVCVNSSYVYLASNALKNSTVKIASVIGFPLGAMSTESKIFEAQKAVEDGADEIDMVIHIGAFLSQDYTFVEKEIHAIKKAIGNRILKVIIETCYLTDMQIAKATQLVVDAKADFVKTSTGFGTRGATFEDMEIMRKITKGNIQIKISGGIRDAETASKYIEMGASRLGTSSGIKLVTNGNFETDTY